MLTAGTKLGPYEIVAPLGAGGMGEVYRARDTKLNRDVAIKVLPAVANDPDRLARFSREAQVLASLNHPNIAHIHGLEEVDGVTALVMELVEGEDLAQRIARGPLPLDEALAIARQIADALEAAHEQGIIHRDLKPANIKVRADGTVKVLDFGLAKAMEPAGGSNVNAMNSPTLSMHATQAGIILGTAAYMSPEQARGRAVDKRADIWAFGCVLYEMLTGRQLFEGEDLTEILASVVKEQADISKAPPQVQRLLRKCLEKDPKKRLRDVGDAWDLLDEPPTARAGVPQAAPHRSWIGWTSAGVLAVALAGLTFVHLRQAPVATARRAHLFVQLLDNAAPGFFALSPDGRWVAMGIQSQLTVRSLESGELRTLTGTGTPRAIFWSPNSNTIAFFSGGDRTLKSVRASGGVPEVLCENVDGTGGGTWNRAGTILFSTRTGLMRASASGGGCTDLIRSDSGVFRAHPAFLPDGDHFLYLQQAAEESRTGVYVGSLREPVGRRVLADRSSALFIRDGPTSNRGRLLFVREQTLMAQAFDTASLELSGEPEPVANHVGSQNNSGQVAAAVSDEGTLVYLVNSRVERQMLWYDRAGAEAGRAPATGLQYAAVSLSPDGRRVLFLRADPQARTALWVDDLERNQEVRLTNPTLPAGAAVWSPDGQRFAFSSAATAQDRAVFVKGVNGGAERALLTGGKNPVAVSDWSRDGRWIVYTESDPKTGPDIWLLPYGGDPTPAKPIPLLRTNSSESQGQLSPDGKWLAYTSNDAGTTQHVYLRAFNGSAPLSETKFQVSLSSANGREPRWRADGKELFYLEAQSNQSRVRIMSVAMGAGANPAGSPKPLFEFRSGLTVVGGNVFAYSPSADGQRFLVDASATDAQPSLEVILNWAGSRP